MAQRNGLRQQKLVNALLDFSRVEAGRIQAVYQPTDLAALTHDLASSFRAACEKAGLTYDQAADVIYASPHTVRRMERAEGGLKPLNVKSLLIAYGVTSPADAALATGTGS